MDFSRKDDLKRALIKMRSSIESGSKKMNAEVQISSCSIDRSDG